MLTGARPFRGRSYAELLMRVIEAPPTPVAVYDPSLPSDVDAVMEGVLAKDPDARFTSAEAFVGALRAALGLGASPLRRLANGLRSLFGR
jgi:serine/threonine-protein kinase